jgi:hypothetical protein
MWVPYNLLSPLKAESPKPAISASEAATNVRDFVVGFFLRNPVTRNWETDILVSPSDRGEQITIGGRQGTVQASGNRSGKLEEIIYTLPAIGAVHALSACHQHVVRRLGEMILQYGRGIELVGWRVADIEHGARWRCIPFRPSALTASSDMRNVPPAYDEALRLYREARSTTSARWRLICAGAIIDAVVARREPFDIRDGDRELVNYGVRPVTNDMLIRSNAIIAHPHLKGATVGEVRDLIEPRRQAFLAALAISGRCELAMDSGYAYESALAALANLADLMARDLMLASLRAGGYLEATATDAECEPLELAGLS